MDHDDFVYGSYTWSCLVRLLAMATAQFNQPCSGASYAGAGYRLVQGQVVTTVVLSLSEIPRLRIRVVSPGGPGHAYRNGLAWVD